MADKIKITILEDGTIKSETDKVSMANHANADGFFTFMAGKLGGVFKRIRKAGALSHHHAHDHEHAHGGEHHHH